MPPRIAIAVVERSKRFLLAKHRRKDGDHWEFPGGRAHAGEQDAQAVVREVREETGVLAEAIAPLGDRLNGEGRSITYWLCGYVSGEARVADPTEVSDIRWVTGREAMSLLTPPVFMPVADHLRRVRS